MIAWSAHLSLLFAEQPLAERPRAARRAGFPAVESWWPPEGEAEAWAAAVRREGLRVTSVNSYCGAIEAGERGFLNVPQRREQVLRDVARAVALAESVGASFVNVPVGRAAPGRGRRAQLAHVAEVLRECATLAGEAGVVLLVEPMNDLDVPGYLVPDAPVAAALLEEVGSASVRMLYDAYHAARAGRDPAADVRSFAGLVEHVQFADCPGRGAPGTGGSDLWALVESLSATGYEGAIGLEYEPRGPTPESLRFLARAPAAAPFPAVPVTATQGETRG